MSNLKVGLWHLCWHNFENNMYDRKSNNSIILRTIFMIFNSLCNTYVCISKNGYTYCMAHYILYCIVILTVSLLNIWMHATYIEWKDQNTLKVHSLTLITACSQKTKHLTIWKSSIERILDFVSIILITIDLVFEHYSKA